MRVYVSGPMSGIEDYNRPAFKAAADLLKRNGFDSVNPADYDDEVEDGSPWADYLKKDLKLIAGCDAICMLQGWENSGGARLEFRTVFDLGMAVYKFSPLSPQGMVFMMQRTDRVHKQG